MQFEFCQNLIAVQSIEPCSKTVLCIIYLFYCGPVSLHARDMLQHREHTMEDTSLCPVLVHMVTDNSHACSSLYL